MHVFQFTHPGKGATFIPDIDEHRGIVSIHAPWEGCDCQIVGVIIAPIVFQFTHPGKGATARYVFDYVSLKVSIHAPWEGCDLFYTAVT